MESDHSPRSEAGAVVNPDNEDDHSIRAALRVQLGGERRKQTGVKGRKKSERASLLRPDDGRLTHREAVVQLNVGIEQHWKQWLARAKVDHKMDIFEIVERGLAMVKAELERNGGGRA